jgi:tRNA(adenine34) deaminase
MMNNMEISKKNDVEFMKMALKLAQEAAKMGEIPVGAIVVNGDGEIISSAYNLRETDKKATAHAEILAIEQACAALCGWRLQGCTLYVTLEPCPMCAGRW